MKPNAPCSPSTFEDHAEIKSRLGDEVAEQFLMSDALLRDHLQSAELKPIDPLLTVQIMSRIDTSAPSPSWLRRVFTITPIIGVIVFVFTLGFVSGYVASGTSIDAHMLTDLTLHTFTSPTSLWILLVVGIISLGIWQMETTS